MRRYCLLLIAIAASAASCSTTTPTTTTTVPPPLATLELGADGLGDVVFGLSPDDVITDITALYGSPDHDSDWIPSADNIYGACPGDTMRAIGWGSLLTVFIDDRTSDLGGWFYTWTYGYDYSTNTGGTDPRELSLRTADGIGLGTTISDLEAAWGEDLTITGNVELDVWSFVSEANGLRGLLSGGTAEDTVTLLEPTVGCGA